MLYVQLHNVTSYGLKMCTQHMFELLMLLRLPKPACLR